MISVLLNDAIKDNIIVITETWIRYSQSDNKKYIWHGFGFQSLLHCMGSLHLLWNKC